METMSAAVNVQAGENRKNASDQPPDERVTHYTNFFLKLADPDRIFQSFESKIPVKSRDTAKVIGSLWYHLSEAIVDILCVALAKLENPYIRHFVIQTAYEELGENSEKMIHTTLLRQCLKVAGVDESDILKWSGEAGVKEAIDKLHQNLKACKSDAEICGLLLGLEIIAYENIRNVVNSLTYSEAVGKKVMATPWVRLHNTMEEEHIRRAVSVFVRFTPDLTSQRKFVHRFCQAIEFWQQFWGAIAKATASC
jgi:hypothetical protein